MVFICIFYIYLFLCFWETFCNAGFDGFYTNQLYYIIIFIITEGCMLLMASLPAMDTVTDTCPVAHQNGTAHRESADTRPAAVVLRLHLYHTNQGVADGSFLSYPPGDYVAEELCIDAAKACSEYSRCASLHKEPPFMFFSVTWSIDPKIRLSRGHSKT